MKLRNAIKQSCDIYFYEMARLLGVDRLSIIAKRYGLGSNILKNVYFDEKKGDKDIIYIVFSKSARHH